MTTIATAYVQIVPSMDGVESNLKNGLSGASESAGSSASSSFSSSFTKGIATVGKVGAAALAATTTAVTGFGASAVSAGADFDSAMSQVAATMGYTMDELNDSSSEASQNIETLRNFAQEMGSSTAFSATEAAEALNYMALAGYDTETSMSMLPTVLDLAASGAMNLADASDMVTDVSSALGLSIDETTVMVDQMAAAASSSNTSVSQLGDALLTIGATAANVSGGTQELSTILGVLADNGIKGSEGGTHLRNMLLSLQDAAEEGKVAMGDFSVEVYDSEGNMRSMIDIIGDMQSHMEGMNQESKDAIISGVFNKTDLASVNALLNTSSERFDALGAAIEDSSGAASAMAEVQLDNLSGDITLFQSALEGAKIAISDQLTPTLREFVQFGSEGLSEITAAFQESGVEGAVDVLGTYLSDGLNMVTSKLPSFVEAGASLLTSLVEGLLENTDTIVSSATDIIVTLTTTLMTLLPMLLDAGLQILSGIISGIAEALPELIPSAISMIEQIGNAIIDNLDILLDASIQLLDAVITGITDNIDTLVEVAVTITTKLFEALLQEAPVILEAGVNLVLKLVSGLIQALPNIVSSGSTLISSLISSISSNLPQILETGITLIGELLAGIIQAWPQIIAQIPTLTAEIFSAFTSVDWAGLGLSIIQGIGNGILNSVSTITSAAKSAATSALNAAKAELGINSPSRKFRDEVGESIPEGIALGIDQNTNYVTEAVNDLANQSMNAFDVNGVVASATQGQSTGISSSGVNGMTFTIYETIDLGDTKLKDIISKYTIEQIGNETRAVKVSQGGYYGV